MQIVNVNLKDLLAIASACTTVAMEANNSISLQDKLQVTRYIYYDFVYHKIMK